ncbi:MAG: IclR family transcriptional regulator [Micromonosporaceae bacterium]
MSNSKPETSPVQSVDRAVTILEILARQGEAGVTEIAHEIGVHKSTAFRLVSALEARDLVEQNSERGKYRLGVGVVRLAGAAAARLDLVQEARPVCRRLATETGETVNIVVMSDHGALYLDQVAGSSAMQPHNWIGQRLPLHATSNGKVLLAFRQETLQEALETPLRRFTDHTVTTLKALEAQLDQVRQQGYAVAVDELEMGLTAIGAPVHNADDDCVASLSASGSSYRLTPERIEEIAKAVRVAADEVSRRLGWRGRRA